MAFNCDWLCKIIEAEISRLRMVAINLSKFGIWPMLANSSKISRTWTGSRPPYLSSARSQSKLISWLWSIARMKLKVVSVSLIMRNSTVFSSPMVSSSISSSSISSRTSRMSKGAKRAPQLIRIEERVLPAESRNFLYCRTAKWSGSFCSNRSNIRSTGL